MKTPLETRGSRANDGKSARLGKKQPDGTHAHRIAHVPSAIEAVSEVGLGTARVWRLYMAGSRLGFDRNQIELHQVLGVRLAADGRSGMPLRPDWEQPRVLAG